MQLTINLIYLAHAHLSLMYVYWLTTDWLHQNFCATFFRKKKSATWYFAIIWSCSEVQTDPLSIICSRNSFHPSFYLITTKYKKNFPCFQRIEKRVLINDKEFFMGRTLKSTDDKGPVWIWVQLCIMPCAILMSWDVPWRAAGTWTQDDELLELVWYQ